MEPNNPPLPLHSSREKWLVPFVCVLLVGLVFGVFGQTCQFQFVNYDDDHHVYANPAVTNGLTWQGVAQVFQHSHDDYWHPLDFVSHMIDCQFYGLNPAGHHLTNVFFHALVSILLFLVLRRMTLATWPSAFVAVLFAIHPLHVESVAWISERKDMLQGFFFVITLAAYTRYVLQPRSVANYLLIIFFFILGLMSKPTLMALPFLLLVLDYWPYGRYANGKKSIILFGHLLIEKIPLMILSLASCLEAASGNRVAFESSREIPAGLQIENALTSYVAYLGQTLWPVNLAVLYPFPVEGIPFEKICLVLAILISISVVAVIMMKKHPCFFAGWFWYLIMLVPTIGFIQAGAYARADRYMYLPQAGLSIMVAWGVQDLISAWRYKYQVLSILMIVLIVGLAMCSWKQTSYWRDSETLWRHTLVCTSLNPIAHGNLGAALAAEGDNSQAIEQFQMALAIDPRSAQICFNLAGVLARENRMVEAVQYNQKAIALKPGYAEAENNLGILLADEKHIREAILSFENALADKPDYIEADNNLGIALASQGRLVEAIGFFQKAIAINPQYADAHYNLANALVLQRQTALAIREYQETLRLNPNYEAARRQLHALKAE